MPEMRRLAQKKYFTSVAITKLTSKEVKERRAATVLLRFSGFAKKAKQTLVGLMLTDPDHLVRANAALALGKPGYTDVILPLKVALGDRHVMVRCKAIDALVKIYNSGLEKQALQPIIAALNKGDVHMRRQVVTSLNKFIFIRTPIRVITKALHDPDRIVRQLAAWILVKSAESTFYRSPTIEALNAIRAIFKNKKGDAKVQRAVAHCIDLERSYKDMHALLLALDSPDIKVRELMFYKLLTVFKDWSKKKGHGVFYLEVLKETWGTELSVQIKILRAVVSSMIKNKDVVDALGKLIRDPHPQVRLSVATGLGNIASIKSIKYLLNNLYDTDAKVRHAKFKALLNLNYWKMPTFAVIQLGALAFTRDIIFDRQLIGTLEEIGREMSAPALISIATGAKTLAAFPWNRGYSSVYDSAMKSVKRIQFYTSS
jgi:HEAT repeat protein